jgi:CubicO group peptidase (beta-lactamase class C family)
LCLSPDPLVDLLHEAEGSVAPSLSAVVLRGEQAVFVHQPDRVYDLASLTKVLATTELVLRAVEAGALGIDGGHPLWPAGVTTRLLLQHCAGCLWWRELWREGDRAAILAAACQEPLVTPPGTRHTYSDLGFLCLGAALEAEGGARLDVLLERAAPAVAARLRWGDASAEPTEGGLRGLVHDDNARGMGGVAPHAGLFGTAHDVAAVARRWLTGGVPLATRAFHERGLGSHALGWDTPSGDQSSAGARPPSDAVGHTGFTGTSVWMSPSGDLVAVLLTNRVAYGRDPVRIRDLRHRWHQLVWDRFAPASGPVASGAQPR